jgi:hypothetical protein
LSAGVSKARASALSAAKSFVRVGAGSGFFYLVAIVLYGRHEIIRRPV